MSFLDFFSRRSGRSVLLATALMAGGATVNASDSSAATKSSMQKKVSEIMTPKEVEDYIQKVDKFVLSDLAARVKAWEGVVLHPYLDKGILTVGAGCHIHSFAEFNEFDFTKKDGTLLDSEEKKAYYATAVAFQKEKKRTLDNYKASYFANFFAYQATPASVDKVLLKRLSAARDNVKKKLGKEAYYNLHFYAHESMIDMEYNLGRGKFVDKKGGYPKFFAAARQENYEVLKKECHRKGVNEKRNNDTAALFDLAGKTRWFKLGTLAKTSEKMQMLAMVQYQNKR